MFASRIHHILGAGLNVEPEPESPTEPVVTESESDNTSNMEAID
jgi:hypothetical protein